MQFPVTEEHLEEVQRVAKVVNDFLRQEGIGTGKGVLGLLAVVYSAAAQSPDLLFKLSVLQALSGTMETVLHNIIEGQLSGNSTRTH